ncbi:MAG: glycerol-3-phosphate 1-O-acyltransferase PlsY [Phycisphaerae bacterium]|nr:glycerol-3-phosphate 1-O-acyltransferase PlsY [Phycisphaerae bacterium]
MALHPTILYGAFPLGGYALGSVPVGVLLARARGVDLRQVGSGNVGATNVARACGRRWGILCFCLDFAKGFVPALVAGLILRSGSGAGTAPPAAHQAAWLAAGCGAILGHVFSVWLGFRGGKGVATSLGVVCGVFPYMTLPGLAALAVWLAVTGATRYVSLGSVLAAVAFVPLQAGLAAVLGWPVRRLWPLLAFAAAMAVLILLRHRHNLRRLLNGTENKIGRRKPPA